MVLEPPSSEALLGPTARRAGTTLGIFTTLASTPPLTLKTSASSIPSVSEHSENVHDDEKVELNKVGTLENNSAFLCDFCGVCFQPFQQLLSHIKSDHEMFSPIQETQKTDVAKSNETFGQTSFYSCAFCKRNLVNLSKLREHIKFCHSESIKTKADDEKVIMEQIKGAFQEAYKSLNIPLPEP